MTINTYGIPTQINGAKFAKLLGILADMRSPEGVYSGDFAVTPSSGRTVHVATSGGSVVGGLLVESDSVVSVTHDANPASNDRMDIVAVQTNTAGTQTGAGTIVIVKGSPAATPQPPGLTQTLGGTWQTALARVTVRAGASAVLSGDIADARPAPRRQRTVNDAGFSEANVGSGAGQVTVLTGTLADPGWPYRVKAEGNVKVQNTSDGNGHVTVRVFVGNQLVSAVPTDKGCTGVAPLGGEVSDIVTGSVQYHVTVQGVSMNDAHYNVDASQSNLVLSFLPA